MAKVVDIAQSLSIGRTDPCAPQPLRPGAPVRPLPAGSMYLGVAQEIVPTLRDFGLDPDPIIRAAGLDPHLFEDEDNVIPFAAMGRLCARSVARTNCPHFGLLVGRRATIRSLGMVGRLMLHSETVGDALRSLVSNPSAQNRGAVAALAVTDDTAVFSYAVYQPETESADQITDGALACTVNAMRTLLGADWAPVEVLLPRASPADAEPYRRHFRAPVRFNQEIGALVLPVSCLQRRIAGADPFLRTILEERVVRLEGDLIADDIRRLLRTRLANDTCSVDGMAGLLTMHRRTLSRRLGAEGTRFRTVVNEVRFEIARQLLTDTGLSFGQIAAALDYSEASAFTRAFRRWSGQTPSAWRASKQHREDIANDTGGGEEYVHETRRETRHPEIRTDVRGPFRVPHVVSSSTRVQS
jgi:AraC-like DNA-binding protein